MAAEVTGPKLKSAQHVTENKWLEQVARAAERSVDLKAEVEQLKVKKYSSIFQVLEIKGHISIAKTCC
jgi:hypothetical protein